MEEYMNRGIKDIIKAFPAVGKSLEKFGVGCVSCSLGSCLLKDVIEIHNLSPENESELMYSIEKEIYPDRKIEKRPPRKMAKADGGEIRYSPPVRKLVDEHTLIKRLIAAVPGLIDYIKQSPGIDKDLILGCVDFIRSYADKYHHMKEEDILFSYTDKDLDIIKVMYEDHKTGRSYVKNVVDGVKEGDKEKIAKNLDAYGELLTQHIKKEDEILYPWLDRTFDTKTVGELYKKFNDADASIGGDVQGKYEAFIEGLEKRLSVSLA
ncbi:MAG: hypothetical protein AUJ75_01575 [Candidatus Omnitrophica bacterium CG1_02_49_10]|nr:MAG: hypothetical protein AUJ75_01575 [Candidatus Omnitrophica bacterium CG1_02_49_10]